MGLSLVEMAIGKYPIPPPKQAELERIFGNTTLKDQLEAAKLGKPLQGAAFAGALFCYSDDLTMIFAFHLMFYSCFVMCSFSFTMTNNWSLIIKMRFFSTFFDPTVDIYQFCFICWMVYIEKRPHVQFLALHCMFKWNDLSE